MARSEDNPRGDNEPQVPDRGTLYDQVAQYYRDYLGRDGSPDEINGWLNSGLTIQGIWDAIRNSDEAKAYSASQQPSGTTTPMPGDRAGGAPPPTTAPSTTAPSVPAGSLGALLQPWTGTFQPPPEPNGPPGWWEAPPTFTPPTYTQPPAFTPPTAESVLNEPGYQFRLGQGTQALEQSAAAKGVLNTGGTLKDLIGYGQQFASNEYANSFNRAAQQYGINLASQYETPYAHAYQSALDTYQPLLQGWQSKMATTQRTGEQNYDRAWNEYLQRYRQFTDWQNSVYNRLFNFANLGAQYA